MTNNNVLEANNIRHCGGDQNIGIPREPSISENQNWTKQTILHVIKTFHKSEQKQTWLRAHPTWVEHSSWRERGMVEAWLSKWTNIIDGNEEQYDIQIIAEGQGRPKADTSHQTSLEG